MKRSDKLIIADNVKVIVLGYTGFIGREIYKLLKNRVKLIGMSSSDVDLTRWDSVKNISNNLDNNTILIMCSAIIRDVEDSLNSFHNNLMMSINISRLLHIIRVKKLVYFSSGAVYGETMNNINIIEETELNPVSYYGIAKYTSELILQKMAKEIELELLILRPSSVYGTFNKKEKYRPAGFIKDIIEKREITLWGDGSELRDFIFVEDVAKLAVQGSLSGLSGVYNIASGYQHSFKSIIDLLMHEMPISFRIKNKQRSKLKVDQAYNITKLRNAFPDFEMTTIKEGIKKIIKEIKIK
jgi:UDP-glucose 4-epimerase